MKIKMQGVQSYPTALTYLPSKFEAALEGTYEPYVDAVENSNRLNPLLLSLALYVRITVNGETPTLEMVEMLNCEQGNTIVSFDLGDNPHFLYVGDDFCKSNLAEATACITLGIDSIKAKYGLTVHIDNADESITSRPFYNLVWALLIASSLISSTMELSNPSTNHLKTVKGKL